MTHTFADFLSNLTNAQPPTYLKQVNDSVANFHYSPANADALCGQVTLFVGYNGSAIRPQFAQSAIPEAWDRIDVVSNKLYPKLNRQKDKDEIISTAIRCIEMTVNEYLYSSSKNADERIRILMTSYLIKNKLAGVREECVIRISGSNKFKIPSILIRGNAVK